MSYTSDVKLIPNYFSSVLPAKNSNVTVIQQPFPGILAGVCVISKYTGDREAMTTEMVDSFTLFTLL